MTDGKYPFDAPDPKGEPPLLRPIVIEFAAAHNAALAAIGASTVFAATARRQSAGVAVESPVTEAAPTIAAPPLAVAPAPVVILQRADWSAIADAYRAAVTATAPAPFAVTHLPEVPAAADSPPPPLPAATNQSAGAADVAEPPPVVAEQEVVAEVAAPHPAAVPEVAAEPPTAVVESEVPANAAAPLVPSLPQVVVEVSPAPAPIAAAVSFDSGPAIVREPPELRFENVLPVAVVAVPSLALPLPAEVAVPPIARPLPPRRTVPAIRQWLEWARPAARWAARIAAVWAAVAVVLTIAFRFVDPPITPLMVTEALKGNGLDRTWVDIDDISPNLVKAVAMSEDGRFCEHWGVDWQQMQIAYGAGSRGASTITMQTAKNLYLWNARGFGLGYLRKAIEVPLSLYISVVLPKRRILEIYLNIVEWGPGVFGAEAAARHHFNTSAANLSARQAALLAVSLPNPIKRNAGKPSRGLRFYATKVQKRMAGAEAYLGCVFTNGGAGQ